MLIGNTAPNAGLYTVLEAIGEQNLNGVMQPLDILAMEETTSNSLTVAPIVSALNTYYGANTYAMAATIQGTESGNNPGTGNGPNALIYNTKTVMLMSQHGVANTPSTSGPTVNRQVLCYGFQAVRRYGDLLRVRQPHEIQLQRYTRRPTKLTATPRRKTSAPTRRC